MKVHQNGDTYEKITRNTVYGKNAEKLLTGNHKVQEKKNSQEKDQTRDCSLVKHNFFRCKCSQIKKKKIANARHFAVITVGVFERPAQYERARVIVIKIAREHAYGNCTLLFTVSPERQYQG